MLLAGSQEPPVVAPAPVPVPRRAQRVTTSSSRDDQDRCGAGAAAPQVMSATADLLPNVKCWVCVQCASASLPPPLRCRLPPPRTRVRDPIVRARAASLLVGSNALLLTVAWAWASGGVLAPALVAAGLGGGLVVAVAGLLPVVRGGRITTTVAVAVAIALAALTVMAAAAVGAAVAYVPAVLDAA
jgi:hypothetical protein